MSKISYSLTKSKITTGLRCPKKLWFDINEKIEIDHFNFHKGNVFGDKIKEVYGNGFDLSHNFDKNIVQLTQDAMNDPKVDIIYEGAFLFYETLVRTDVLIRKADGWKLVEAKCSSSVNEKHYQDISIQYYVLSSCDINITCAKLIYPDGEFIYQGDGNYENLIKSFDVTKSIQDKCKKEVPQYIENFKKLASPSVDCPDIPIEKKKVRKTL